MDTLTTTQTKTRSTTKLAVAGLIAYIATGSAYIMSAVPTTYSKNLLKPKKINSTTLNSNTKNILTDYAPKNDVSCIEYDGGENKNQFSTTSLKNNFDGSIIASGADKCTSTSTLREYFCDPNLGNSLQAYVYKDLVCDPGTQCMAGSCIPMPFQCTDTDGYATSTKGTATQFDPYYNSTRTFTDYCTSSSTLNEFFCAINGLNNVATSTMMNCSPGTVCDGGRCVVQVVSTSLSVQSVAVPQNAGWRTDAVIGAFRLAPLFGEADIKNISFELYTSAPLASSSVFKVSDDQFLTTFASKVPALVQSATSSFMYTINFTDQEFTDLFIMNNPRQLMVTLNTVDIQLLANQIAKLTVKIPANQITWHDGKQLRTDSKDLPVYLTTVLISP